MLPQYTKKTYLSVSLAPGPRGEPDIGTEEFLASYLDYTCWLRVISSHKQFLALSDLKTSKLERLASLGAFYQMAGLVVEDALSMYIAWSLWSRERSRSIADILARVALRLAEPKSRLPDTYARDIQRRCLETDKRLDVYAREYLSQLMLTRDVDLPSQFGIRWRRNPSIKLVPKELRAMWDGLGYYVRSCLEPLVMSKGALLAACYNKIKHGPQMVVMSPGVAAQRRGITGLTGDGLEGEPTLRLLLQGSRTQETDAESVDKLRVAPFLPLDTANIRRWFFQQIVHTTNALFITGTWIFNTNFIDRKRKFRVEAPEVVSIVRDQSIHLDRTFPE